MMSCKEKSSPSSVVSYLVWVKDPRKREQCLQQNKGLVPRKTIQHISHLVIGVLRRKCGHL